MSIRVVTGCDFFRFQPQTPAHQKGRRNGEAFDASKQCTRRGLDAQPLLWVCGRFVGGKTNISNLPKSLQNNLDSQERALSRIVNHHHYFQLIKVPVFPEKKLQPSSWSITVCSVSVQFWFKKTCFFLNGFSTFYRGSIDFYSSPKQTFPSNGFQRKAPFSSPSDGDEDTLRC